MKENVSGCFFLNTVYIARGWYQVLVMFVDEVLAIPLVGVCYYVLLGAAH